METRSVKRKLIGKGYGKSSRRRNVAREISKLRRREAKVAIKKGLANAILEEKEVPQCSRFVLEYDLQKYRSELWWLMESCSKCLLCGMFWKCRNAILNDKGGNK